VVSSSVSTRKKEQREGCGWGVSDIFQPKGFVGRRPDRQREREEGMERRKRRNETKELTFLLGRFGLPVTGEMLLSFLAAAAAAALLSDLASVLRAIFDLLAVVPVPS